MGSPSGWWSGYTPEELHRLLYLHRVDPFGFFCMAALVLTLMTALAPIGPSPGPASVSSSWITLALTVGSMIPIVFNIYKLPLSEKKLDPQMWATMMYFGRFTYLTRWLISMQLLYFATSVYGELHGGWVRSAVYAIATPMASFAAFVSIQFYTLVASSENYQSICNAWNPRGYDVMFIGHVVHAPAVCLAVADVLVAKDAYLLNETRPPLKLLTLSVVVFAQTYVGFATINRLLTGHWPYSVMNSITSPLKLVKFSMIQTTILLLFLGVVWTLQCGVEGWVDL